MTEDQCHDEAERLLGVAAVTSDVSERRRLIDEAMRWRDRAMVEHDHAFRRYDGRPERES